MSLAQFLSAELKLATWELVKGNFSFVLVQCEWWWISVISFTVPILLKFPGIVKWNACQLFYDQIDDKKIIQFYIIFFIWTA